MAEANLTRRRIDRTGRRYGKLVVVGRGPDHQFPGGTLGRTWVCQCDCGNITRVHGASLATGRTISCGCFLKSVLDSQRATHGLSHLPEYKLWLAMRMRCNNPRDPGFPDYGARGVRVCDRWDDFGCFIADMGRRPKGKTLDRYPDTNGNYEPGNCRWATLIEQANNRRDTTWVEWRGRRLTLRDLSEATGINLPALQSRYQRGKRGDALIAPLQRRPAHAAIPD